MSPELASENVGSELPVGAVGTLVSSLVDLAAPPGGADNVIDGDEDAVTGLAITGANSANGTWYYSLDAINWTALGAVSDASAWIMSADADNRLYFRPNASFSGTITDALTFRAWDGTTGTSGAFANATSNGLPKPAFLNADATQNNAAPEIEIARARSAAQRFVDSAAETRLRTRNAASSMSIARTVIRFRWPMQLIAATDAQTSKTSSFGMK